MSYSINSSVDDCYEGTTCLINKMDIRDEAILSTVEAEITAAKSAILSETPFRQDFSFEDYKAIHRFLFEDLYDWAGSVRTIDISKKGTVFTSADNIENQGKRIFERLRAENYFLNLDFENFISNIVDLYCVTNMLHPFQEGNGRAQRVFLRQLIRYNGYDIDFSEIDPDELMIATIHSAHGINDFLFDIFFRNIHR